jgi:hypothetical protein
MQARYYDSEMGRFISRDEAEGDENRPYKNFYNPNTLKDWQIVRILSRKYGNNRSPLFDHWQKLTKIVRDNRIDPALILAIDILETHLGIDNSNNQGHGTDNNSKTYRNPWNVLEKCEELGRKFKSSNYYFTRRC